MKENKGKEIVDEEDRPESQSQVRPLAGDKKRSLSKNLDLGNLPNCRGKKAKHGSSQIIKPNISSSQQFVKIYDVDSSTPIETTPFKTPPSKMTVPATSQPSQQVPSNIIENEDLAWERFQKAVLDEDINVCYDMSLKDFEHSDVHDLFKVSNYIFFLVFANIYFLSNLYFIFFFRLCQNLLQRPGKPQD